MPRLLDGGIKERAQRSVIVAAERFPRKVIALVSCVDCNKVKLRKTPVTSARLPERVAGRVSLCRSRDRDALTRALDHLRRGAVLRGAQAPLVNELRKAEAQEQVIQLRLIIVIPERLLRLKRDRRVCADRGEVIGEKRAVAPRRELFAHAGRDVQRVEAAVNVLQCSEAVEQIHRGLLPHAGDAGDVVAGVSHERLEIHHAHRLESVLLPEHLGRIVDGLGLAHAGLYVAHMGRIGNQLKTVLVAGDDGAAPVLPLADLADRAEEVVRLPALQLQTADAHGVQHLFQQRDLHGEILRHGLALRFIVRVLLMAERRRFEIERDGERLRMLELQKSAQDREKAEDGVRGRAVGRVQHPNAVKGAVDDAVAVQYHQFHGLLPHFSFSPRSSMMRSRSTAAYSYSSI